MHTLKSTDGTCIAYTRPGEGPPLVLVDGAFCYRANGPTPLLTPWLSQHFTVYAYDRRGRGESADNRPYDVQREVDDLQAVLNQAGSDAYVLGSSSGGELVLRVLDQGADVRKVALYEVPYVNVAGAASAPPPHDAEMQLQKLIAVGDRSGAVTYFMRHVFGAPPLFVSLMRYMARSSWERNESVAHTLPYDLALMRDWTIPAYASAIQTPVLVLNGAKAPLKLQLAAQALAAAIPTAEREILVGQSHNPKPGVMVPALKTFFDR